MTPDYVIVSIKLCPKAGNDEYSCTLFCVILLAVASEVVEVIEGTIWSPRSQEAKTRPV